MGVFRTLCSVEKYFQDGKQRRKLSKNAGKSIFPSGGQPALEILKVYNRTLDMRQSVICTCTYLNFGMK